MSGINDEAAFGKPAVLMGTCTSCHNTPNGGNHSVVAPLNIGLVDASAWSMPRAGPRTCRSTPCATRPPARPSRSPTRGAR
ncbi:MAG TPA: hypothetical protein VGD37_13640 [Kofleriaceae bacterium]